MLALPIFPGSHPPSIVGAHELNFCVRDGNRWTLMAINTNYDDGCEPSLYMLKADWLSTQGNYSTKVKPCQEEKW